MRDYNDQNGQELLDICLEHEKRYRFDTFDREEAWKLGCILKDLNDTYAAKPVAMEIIVNGLKVFCYYPEGTTLYYEKVLVRKHNTVKLCAKSSLRFYAEALVSGLDPEKDMLLDPNVYQFRGGAFPLSLKSGEVIGSICVAGMAHTQDHGLIIEALERFFADKK